MIYPPSLRQGDKIAIVSPASKIDKRLLKETADRLTSWGFVPVIGKHAASSSGTFAGTIRQRTSDFQRAMDDEDIRGIFCSRGGYGVVHILDKLDFTAFGHSPKWLMGFSDITALHSLFQYHGYASIHSLMAHHLCVEPENDPCAAYLKNILDGNFPDYTVKGHRLNREGKANGTLRGGNLSVMNGLRGTPYDIPAEGTILFVEDVSERPHCIERIFYNLKLGGVLDKLSGMIIGQFTEYDEDKSLGKELYNAISDILKNYDFPVCFGFPVGHVTHNLPLICGAEVELEVSKSKCLLYQV